MDKLNHYLAQLTNFLATLVGALLGLRFILRLLGANSENEFVSWVYDTSAPLLSPFENIFPTVRVEDGFVIEITTLFALLVYGIIASLFIYLLAAITPAKTNKKR
ncbi:TPA: YggT family protein [Candidatus Saccharibacteria bacterium]|nr:YggT family protein [Candidatus Saccharibacteria bacterium]HIO87906.1 YggT family protein [Candidatus Saccharibacteria bacterium]